MRKKELDDFSKNVFFLVGQVMALQGVVGAFQYKNKQKDTQDTDVVKTLTKKISTTNRQTKKLVGNLLAVQLAQQLLYVKKDIQFFDIIIR